MPPSTKTILHLRENEMISSNSEAYLKFSNLAHSRCHSNALPVVLPVIHCQSKALFPNALANSAHHTPARNNSKALFVCLSVNSARYPTFEPEWPQYRFRVVLIVIHCILSSTAKVDRCGTGGLRMKRWSHICEGRHDSILRENGSLPDDKGCSTTTTGIGQDVHNVLQDEAWDVWFLGR